MSARSEAVPRTIADGEAPEAVQPGKGAHHHPPVLAKPLAAFDATTGNARGDPTGAALLAAAAMILSLVGVQLAWPATGSARAADPNARHGIQSGGQHPAVVTVGTAQRQAQRRAVVVRDEVALGARPAAVRGVRAGLRAPLLALILALSSAARDQSMAFAAGRRSSSIRCRRRHTPASCQSRSRRQQVMPDPQPISTGRRFQAVPVVSTKTMPVRAARFGS